MRENLEFSNRLYVGSIILIFFLISFFFNLDFFLLFIISIISLFEVTQIFLKRNKSKLRLIFLLIIVFFLFISFFVFHLPLIIFLSFSVLTLFFIFINQKNIDFYLVILILLFLLFLHEVLQYDRKLFYIVFTISFINDTSAFLIGSYFKGPLIIPSISPKKTWSGTISSFIIVLTIFYFVNINFIFSIIFSLSLFFGDILFSYIKRKLMLKDFSKILLSHGGILDRLDSIFLFVLFLTTFYLT